MQVLKMTGHTNPTPEDAQDQIAGVRVIPGFIAAYIEPKDNRVVSFHQVSELDKITNGLVEVELAKGQKLVEFVLGESAEKEQTLFDMILSNKR